MKKTFYLREKENLVGLLSTAFYGSSWAFVAVPEELAKKYRGYTREDRWAEILLDGGYVWVCDQKLEYKLQKLTLEKLEMAWQSEDKEAVRAKANILNEDDDFYDADAIIQIAVFGEVVFG